MKIEKDRMVSVTYELREGDLNGEVIETVASQQPLMFLYDSGSLLKEFEKSLLGKKQGDNFECFIKSENAYGEYHDDRVIPIPLKAFEIDGEVNSDVVAVGKNVPMQDKQGNKLSGLILEIGEENVKVDFNHPLAGKALAFKGEVLEVREATEQEINAHHHGHDASQCSSCNSSCE